MRITPRQFILLSMLCAAAPLAIHIPTAQALQTNAPSASEIKSLDLQALIEDAKAKKLAKLTIPAGTYRITSDTVKLQGLSNFELDGTGATLLFQIQKVGRFQVPIAKTSFCAVLPSITTRCPSLRQPLQKSRLMANGSRFGFTTAILA